MKKIMLVLVLMLSGLVFAQEKKEFTTGSAIPKEDGFVVVVNNFNSGEYIYGRITAILRNEKGYTIKISDPEKGLIELYIQTDARFALRPKGLVTRSGKIYLIGSNYLCLEIEEHMPED